MDFWAEFYRKMDILRWMHGRWGPLGISASPLCTHIHLLIYRVGTEVVFPTKITFKPLSFCRHTLCFQFAFCKPEPNTIHPEKQTSFGSLTLDFSPGLLGSHLPWFSGPDKEDVF